MDKMNILLNVIEDIQKRTNGGWETMSQKDRVAIKAAAIQFRNIYQDYINSIEAWERVNGKLIEVGNCDVLIQSEN